MLTLDNAPRFIQYIAFAILFIMGQSAAMWGLYYTLPFKNLSMFQAYKMAIPFAWLDWIFMTLAINIGHKYNLVTPTQDTFILIIVQFSLILIINQYYLKLFYQLLPHLYQLMLLFYLRKKLRIFQFFHEAWIK